MGACEIAFVAVLFVILLAWYYKAVFQTARPMAGASAACQPDSGAAADDATDAPVDDADTYETDLGHPTFDDQEGFADSAVSPQSLGGMGSAQAVSDLTPFGDSTIDLNTSTAAAHPEGAPISEMARSNSGVRRQKNRYARAMAAERQWQMQNQLQMVNQKVEHRSNALGSKVGFQAVMDLYQGDTLAAPRKNRGGRRIHMVEGHPHAVELSRKAQVTGSDSPRAMSGQRRRVGTVG